MKGNGGSMLSLPVRLTESCRVEFFQQEMSYYVEGVLVWFVKHIPMAWDKVRAKLNVNNTVGVLN